MKERCALILIGLSFIFPAGVPVVAQDSFASMDAEDDPLAPQNTQKSTFVWCSAENGERQEFYISDVRRLLVANNMMVSSLSGHFAQTMNARFGIHLAMNAQHCHIFRSSAAAQNARSIVTAEVKKKNLTIRNAGIF